jgi:hypothetical protein
MSHTTDVSIRFDEVSDGDIGRFHLDRQIAGERGQAFFDASAAEDMPLARRLFTLPAVEAILLAERTVMVRKRGSASWPDLRPDVERMIRSEFSQRDPADRSPDRRSPAPQLPEAHRRDRRTHRERMRVPQELKWVVGWLVAGAFVAQLLWASVWRVTDGSSAYLVRLAGTLAVLALWIMFTRSAD